MHDRSFQRIRSIDISAFRDAMSPIMTVEIRIKYISVDATIEFERWEVEIPEPVTWTTNEVLKEAVQSLAEKLS
jgi:hypothetical protein